MGIIEDTSYQKLSSEERKFLDSEELKQIEDAESRWEYWSKKTRETYYKIKALENYLESNDPLADDWSVHYESLTLALKEQERNSFERLGARYDFNRLKNLAEERRWKIERKREREEMIRRARENNNWRL